MIVSETVKSGVVVECRGNKARVKIDCSEKACEGCRISELCNTPKYAPELTAVIDDGLDVKVGDNVILVGRVKGWLKGWILLAGLPCIAILAGLVVGSLLELKDGLTGAIGIGCIILYYVVLWLLRGRVDRSVEWVVESIHPDQKPQPQH